MLNPPNLIKFRFAIIAFTLCCFVQPAFAGLFKWVDDAGKTHYTDDKGKIPLKYRKKTHIKKLRTLNDRTSKKVESSNGNEGGTEQEGTSGSGKIKDKEILSEQELKTVNETIAFFTSENSRSAKYKGLPNYSTSFMRLRADIENNLPQKKKLLAELSKSKNPNLKGTVQFLNKSKAADEKQLKLVWQQGQPGGYFGRILGEIEVKNSLNGKLKDAIEKSNKLKEAKEKLEQEELEKEKMEKSEKEKKTK